MKTAAFLACLLTLNFAFSQTKAIANKSHSGTQTSLADERDGNFGIAPPHLDTVIRISSQCIVEINNHGWRDTVCNHPYFNNPDVTLADMKIAYPRITFIGFDQKHAGKTTPLKSNKKATVKKQKKGSLYLLGFLILGSLVYTFVPKKIASGRL